LKERRASSFNGLLFGALKMKKFETVILSTPMLLESGNFKSKEISLDEANYWVRQNNPTNFVGHSTVKVLGIQPSTARDVCQSYDEALSLKVKGRLEFGKEYTVEEILELGVTCTLISKTVEVFDCFGRREWLTPAEWAELEESAGGDPTDILTGIESGRYGPARHITGRDFRLSRGLY